MPCVQQASYLEGGPLYWILPLYLHVNKKSDDDDDDLTTEPVAVSSTAVYFMEKILSFEKYTRKVENKKVHLLQVSYNLPWKCV